MQYIMIDWDARAVCLCDDEQDAINTLDSDDTEFGKDASREFLDIYQVGETELIGVTEQDIRDIMW